MHVTLLAIMHKLEAEVGSCVNSPSGAHEVERRGGGELRATGGWDAGAAAAAALGVPGGLGGRAGRQLPGNAVDTAAQR